MESRKGVRERKKIILNSSGLNDSLSEGVISKDGKHKLGDNREFKWKWSWGVCGAFFWSSEAWAPVEKWGLETVTELTRIDRGSHKCRWDSTGMAKGSKTEQTKEEENLKTKVTTLSPRCFWFVFIYYIILATISCEIIMLLSFTDRVSKPQVSNLPRCPESR